MNKKVLVYIFGLLLIIGVFIFTKNKETNEVINALNSNALTEIIINNNFVDLKEDIKDYELEIDCSKIDLKEQFIYYELSSVYKDSKVTLRTNVYKNEELIEDITEATNLNIKLEVNKDNYKQIFTINAACVDNKK